MKQNLHYIINEYLYKNKIIFTFISLLGQKFLIFEIPHK